MTRRNIALLAFMILLLSGISAQDRSQWFEFYLPWDDSTNSITNLSSCLDAPAGKHGFVQVTPDGHFAFEHNSLPTRFVGVVNVALANYPTQAQARILSARMAKFGINLVRIHLTDVDGTSGLFDNSSSNTQVLNSTRMDKMDFFTKCLKEKGIYYNFCIQSGRVFKTGDTLDSPVVNDQSKYVTLFNPRLIELQKRFARQTLMHVNPYTGLSYANDPAMASVELTNENSLFNGWFGWQRDYLFDGTAGGIGPWYAHQLDTLFQKWLQSKYPSDSALAEAWKGQTSNASELILNNSFENNYTSWITSVTTSAGAVASFSIDTLAWHGDKSARIQVDKAGTAGWHVHIKTNNFSVVKDQGYKVSFRARSNVNKPLLLEIMENQTWYYYGGPTYTPDTSWKKFEFYFTASRPSNMLILQFGYGLQTGTFWLDSVSVTPFGGEGLGADESLELQTVRRTKQVEIGKYSVRRVADNAAFYAHLEERYTEILKSYLTDSCGLRCPVTFTNNYFGLGSILTQSKADYMDTHFYWDHPGFPAGWSETNFTMQNKSMLKDPGGSTMNKLPFCRVKNKPLVLSEYNHPYPYIFQTEMPSIVFAYGSLHDLDGILYHAYYDYMNNYTIRKQDMFFDIAMNPVVMSQMLLSLPYRNGQVKSSSDIVYAHYKEQDVYDRTKIVQEKYMLHLPDGDYGNSFLQQSFSIASFTADSSRLEGTLSKPGSKIVSSTQELTWDSGKGILTVNTPGWQGATGYLKGQTLKIGDITISGVTTTDGLGFASIHLLAMDSLPIRESKKLVILTSARLENQGFLWNSSLTTPVSVGGTKALCEPVTATLSLDFTTRDSLRLFRLDERGARSTELTPTPGAGSILLPLNEKTLWYEILNDSARADHSSINQIPGLLRLSGFPNPCSDQATLNFVLKTSQQVNLLLCDAQGKLLMQRKVQVEGGDPYLENLDLTGRPAGLYFCGIQLQNGAKTFQRLVKMEE
ncbi:MAG: carbohydrate binding domain-containing protein [Bacteroidales bacterium]